MSLHRLSPLSTGPTRRSLLRVAAGCVAAPWAIGNAWSQSAPGRTRLGSTLRIFIPANAGGGWDQTGRALGAALQANGNVDKVEYENLGGKGGTVGLARYHEKYSDDPNAMLIGGKVMVGAVALQNPPINLSHIQPLARLTSDYLVVVVPASSPYKSAKDLSEAMRANLAGLTFAGGSAGGVDHIFAGVFARATKAPVETLVYKPFTSGPDVVAALLDGRAAVGISGYSELSEGLQSGKLRALGISARRTLFGLPTLRDQGVDASMANWRGVNTGQKVAPARVAEMVQALRQATAHESWQQTLKQNRWDGSWLAEKELSNFIELELTTARVMNYLLKLKA